MGGQSSYERAVQLDPNFAIAWARLSRAETLSYIAHDDTHGALAAGPTQRKVLWRTRRGWT